MRRLRTMEIAAFALVLGAVATRAGGLVEHVGVLSGTPVSDRSWILGPSVVVLHLLAVTVAPVLALAALLDRLVGRREVMVRSLDPGPGSLLDPRTDGARPRTPSGRPVSFAEKTRGRGRTSTPAT